MNLTEEENLTGISLLIDTGFAKFLKVLQFSVKKFNGFELLNIFTKSPIFDVWHCVKLARNIPHLRSIYLFKVKYRNTRASCEIFSKSLLLTLNKFHTFFRCFHCRLQTNKCCLGSLNCRTECISKRNSSNA